MNLQVFLLLRGNPAALGRLIPGDLCPTEEEKIGDVSSLQKRGL
jgi:hypothetical protein